MDYSRSPYQDAMGGRAISQNWDDLGSGVDGAVAEVWYGGGMACAIEFYGGSSVADSHEALLGSLHSCASAIVDRCVLTTWL